jgi:spore coat protein U-like protein
MVNLNTQTIFLVDCATILGNTLGGKSAMTKSIFGELKNASFKIDVTGELCQRVTEEGGVTLSLRVANQVTHSPNVEDHLASLTVEHTPFIDAATRSIVKNQTEDLTATQNVDCTGVPRLHSVMDSLQVAHTSCHSSDDRGSTINGVPTALGGCSETSAGCSRLALSIVHAPISNTREQVS